MMKKSIKHLLLLICLVTILVLPYFVFAQSPTQLLENTREGSGYAEAASKANSTPSELKLALEAGLSAIREKPDEPFSYYAVGLVYKSLGNAESAMEYVSNAEALEARRDTNIHTYDKSRHHLYRSLVDKWRL